MFKLITKLVIISSLSLLSACATINSNSNKDDLIVDNIEAVIPVPQTAEWSAKWWMPRHQQKLAEKNKLGTVDLVFLGDSITHAWDKKGKEVWKEYYSTRNALNIGFSGDRTEHVLWRLQNGAVDNISPKLLVMMIGTNNVGHRLEASADTAMGIKVILADLKKRLPETKILLLAIFPRGKDNNDNKRQLNNGTNAIIKNYADGKRVHYLNINEIFLTKDGILEKSIMNDLLHPNKDQYKAWADAIEPQVKELMGE